MLKCDRCQKLTETGTLIEGIDYCCPDCIKKYEDQRAAETGKMVLWVDHDPNDPIELVLHNWFWNTIYRITKHTNCRHNIGRVQNSYYFYGPDGRKWVGKHFGFNNYVRCKRLKHQYQNIDK